jgi:hypothetical protein
MTTNATVQPASVNFWLYSGATFIALTTLKDTDGTPIDLTGCTAVLQARRDIADVLPVFTCSTTDGTLVLGGAAGTISLQLTALVTAGLQIDFAGEIWFHDLLMTQADDVTVSKVYQGAIIACPSVTR